MGARPRGARGPRPDPEATESAEDRESVEVQELLEQGNRFAREGKYDDACVSYEEALRLLPDYSQARFNLAVALLRDGRREEAREQLTIFIGRIRSIRWWRGRGDARRNRKGSA